MAMPTPEEISAWSPEERMAVARLLELERTIPVPTGRVLVLRRVVIALTVVGALTLVPWVGYLAGSLPKLELVKEWSGAWVGFDVIMAIVLAITAYLAWSRRQLAAIGFTVAATMLLVDAWFDLWFSWGTSALPQAAIEAAFVEVPVAALFVVAVILIERRAVRSTAELRGEATAPRLWRAAMVNVRRPVRARRRSADGS